MCVSCCEQETSRDGDKFGGTDKSLGVSLNRQGKVQLCSLARRFGKASSQPCTMTEDSLECRSKTHQPRPHLAQGLVLATVNLQDCRERPKSLTTPPKSCAQSSPCKVRMSKLLLMEGTDMLVLQKRKGHEERFLLYQSLCPAPPEKCSGCKFSWRVSLPPRLSHFFFPVDFLLRGQLEVPF